MDVEQFIELVKERPCLYDNSISMNKDKKKKRERKWEEVAAGMEMTSEVAKSKWKNLRDNYSKHLKSKTATSGPYITYKHWNWASNMEFMKKYINCLPSMKNLDHHNHKYSYESEHIDPTQSSSLSDTRSEDVSVNNMRQQASVSRDNQFYQYMENIENDDFDATDLIFLGYAKAIKAFSIRRQAEIKLRIAKIITEEEVAHSLALFEETSVYPDSPVYCSPSPSPPSDPLNPKRVEIKYEESYSS